MTLNGMTLNGMNLNGQTLNGIVVEEFRRPQHDYETALVFGSLAGAPVVLKTFQFHPWALRWLLGWLCRREARLLQELEPIGNTPAGKPWLPLGARRWGRWGVLMPRLEGRPLRELAPGTLPPEFIGRLEEAVTLLHEARVVHLDIKNSGNILVTEGGHPLLLDFAGCLSFRHWPLLGGALTRLFGQIDRAAVLKWKREYFPDTLTPADLALLARVAKVRRWWPFPVRKLYRRGKPRNIAPPSGNRGAGPAAENSTEKSAREP